MKYDLLSNRRTLTLREHHILELVSTGLSAKEIAIEIEIAPRTVERHIENIRLKLGARNRAHLVTTAILMGLLQPSLPQQLEQMHFRY